MYRKSWMACNRKNSSPDRSVVHGLSIVYVKDQMDHSSIQGTVQTYGHAFGERAPKVRETLIAILLLSFE